MGCGESHGLRGGRDGTGVPVRLDGLLRCCLPITLTCVQPGGTRRARVLVRHRVDGTEHSAKGSASRREEITLVISFLRSGTTSLCVWIARFPLRVSIDFKGVDNKIICAHGPAITGNQRVG